MTSKCQHANQSSGISISVKSNRTFLKYYVKELSSEVKILRNEKITDMVMFLLLQTSYYPNLRANKQIAFDLQLSNGVQKDYWVAHIF